MHFEGLRYNPSLVDDMGAVLCPPYDMVTPSIQQALMERHPLNVINLEGGEKAWTGHPIRRTGTRRLQGVSKSGSGKACCSRMPKPAYYLMRHGFSLGGQQRSPPGADSVRRDRGIRYAAGASPRVHRGAGGSRPGETDGIGNSANISPIMSLYRDSGNELGSLFERVMSTAPEVDAKDDFGTDATMWRIGDPADRAAIDSFFSARPVFLADGHHRYEASRHYRADRHAEGSDAPARAHNFVMMTLIAFDDPGLVVLPYHRSLSGLDEELLARVKNPSVRGV